MNYRHAYHAGNFADVLKHLVLVLCLEHLRKKPSPFRVIDTHAGSGGYDLAGIESTKTGEWQTGIGRLLGPGARPLPEAIGALLAPYLAIIRAENPGGALRHYPGSPLIARRLLRPGDRLIACELHPGDRAELARRLARDTRTKTLELDGWLTLKSMLPPKERRGLVLVDPPFEQPGDLERLASGLREATSRFATGLYLLWYPIKDAGPVRHFHRTLRDVGLAKALRAELYVRRPVEAGVLTGCGMIIVNPPWTLEQHLRTVLPFLAERLAQEPAKGEPPAFAPGSRAVLEWLGRQG
jgi:23S rRNA (adenine2030-N6)-methyltransferase